MLVFFAEYRALIPVLPDGYGLRFRNPNPKGKNHAILQTKYTAIQSSFLVTLPRCWSSRFAIWLCWQLLKLAPLLQTWQLVEPINNPEIYRNKYYHQVR